ncbi:tRNA (adenosine(37)-N6)-threonylcarbamoyltransferase complex dimerization subunit type 1 TsaB [Thermodesulfobacteriota bacterium B35]
MDGLLILAIETATGCGSVALTRGGVAGGRLLAEATLQPEVSHSRRLLGSVQWILEAAALSWQDLDGIGVSLGPGSFTGLRIGMAAAKGLAMAAGLPLVGVGTLDGIALSCAAAETGICCLLDARKQEVYAAFYEPDGCGVPVAAGPPVAIRPRRLLESLQAPLLVAGPGVAVHGELFRQHPLARVLPAALALPRAAHIGLLCAERLARGELLDPAVAAPLYVRASEAEVNLKKKNRAQQ